MARPPLPAKPLLVVLGSTGTGKSELAIELATRFRGEIINADAMQMYKGLPIITNKVPVDERNGIPHHLLDHVSLEKDPWSVDDFKREASKVIDEIRERGNLPILVGGTQYYVNPLLFPEVTLDEVQADSSQSFPILEDSTEAMLQELKRVDPVMAERWHPNDRRKIRRSLEIYLQTGRPASELYADQKQRKTAAAEAGDTSPWETLLFWVYTEREALKTRLDKRVDKMLDSGLLGEVKELRALEHTLKDKDVDLDLTKGIWQSIGYKQFESYQAGLAQDLEPSRLEKLKAAALEDMKTATRRYANYQTKWIRAKQVPLLRQQGPAAINSLYLLDSTDVDQFHAEVVNPATTITTRFLNGETCPMPITLSDLARDVLTRTTEPTPQQTFTQRTCELCGTTLVTEQAWQKHIKGAAHKRVVKRKKKLALVPVEGRSAGERDQTGDVADPDLASIFAPS